MKLIILILFTIPLASAESFKIAGNLVSFKEQKGLILKGCEKSCDALKVIEKHKKINLKKIREGMSYTNSVGSDVCHKVYQADALLGLAENKDQRAFCVFKDHSMVEMNSLSSYLKEQKIVKE